MSSKTGVDVKVPASVPFYGALQLRSATPGVGYRSKLGISASGSLTVSLSRVSGGAETALGSSQGTGTTLKAGDTVRLEGVVAGVNPVLVYVRAWKAGSATPNWQLAARDYTTSRITTAGPTRLWGYLSSSAPTATSITFTKVTTSSTTVALVTPYRVTTWATAGTAPSAAIRAVPPPAATTAPASTPASLAASALLPPRTPG